MAYVNNKRFRSACASTQSDQHLCYCRLDSIIPVLAIARFQDPSYSSAEQASLSLNWSQTPKTGFLVTWLIFWWLGWAMVLGSFQCRGVLLLLLIVGQGPAVLAAGAGWVGYIFLDFSSIVHF